MRHNKWKKCLRYVGVTAIMLICGLGMLNGTKSEAKKTKNYEYLVQEDGKVLIRKYIGKKKNVVVPKKIKGRKVYKVGQASFYGTKVTSVTIPKSITKVGNSAFEKCAKLKKVSMPGVTIIRATTFANCKKLKTVKLAKKLEKVQYAAFENCERLTSVGDICIDSAELNVFKNCKMLNSKITFSDKCTEIGDGAFYGCKNMNFTIPNTVKGFGYMSFAFCDKITKITITKNSGMNASAYAGCQNIKEIEILDDSGKWILENGVLYNSDKTSVIYVLPTYAGSLDFLKNVKELGAYAMTGFNQANVVFPEALTSIGDGILFGAKTTNIQWPKNMITVPENAFAYSQITELVLPEGVKTVYEGALRCCEKLKKVTFPKSFEEFYAYTEFTNILPGAKSLEEIVVAEGNKRYFSKDGLLFIKGAEEGKAILVCYPAAKKGKSYTVPKNVELRAYCFDSLKYLRKINIKKSSGVKRISNYIIDCENVKVYLPKTGLQFPSPQHSVDEPLFTNCKNCAAQIKKGSKAVKIFKKYAKWYPDMWAYKVVK